MRRRSNREEFEDQSQDEMDVAGILSKMQEQLASLERKMDTLIHRPSGQAHERRFEHSHRDDRGGQGGGFRERNLYKAICAECNEECEIPFKPSPGRPVYCKECFSKRKNGGDMFREKHNDFPRQSEDTQKSRGKRKSFSRKMKKR